MLYKIFILWEYIFKCKQNKMDTTFKMMAINVIFRRRSSLLVNCFKNGSSNFEIDCKFGIKLHLVK